MLPVEQCSVDQTEEWFSPIWDFLTRQFLPWNPEEAAKIKRLSSHFAIFDGALFRKGFSSPWQRCVGAPEAKKILQEIHEGICGSHQGAKTIALRARRAGFYWPTLSQDAASLVQSCKKCQLYAKMIHTPAQPMKSISSPWPFDVWGIDIVGPFVPGK